MPPEPARLCSGTLSTTAWTEINRCCGLRLPFSLLAKFSIVTQFQRVREKRRYDALQFAKEAKAHDMGGAVLKES